MSIDTSLRGSSGLTRHKNVLTRAERVARLQETDQWTEDSKILGMAKVGNRKPKSGGGKKKKDEEGADAAKK